MAMALGAFIPGNPVVPFPVAHQPDLAFRAPQLPFAPFRKAGLLVPRPFPFAPFRLGGKQRDGGGDLAVCHL